MSVNFDEEEEKLIEESDTLGNSDDADIPETKPKSLDADIPETNPKLDKYYNDPNGKDEHSTPFFMRALDFQKTRILEKMLKRGADINVADSIGFTALMVCAYNNYFKLAEFLIKKRAKLDIQSKDGSTALILATIKNNIYMVDLLLKAGADANIQDSLGNTALFHATRHHSGIVFKSLVEKGAKIDTLNAKNQTLLTHAVKNETIGKGLLEYVIANRPNYILAKDADNKSALDYAKENFETLKRKLQPSEGGGSKTRKSKKTRRRQHSKRRR
jgi:ankyrin repeat protein